MWVQSACLALAVGTLPDEGTPVAGDVVCRGVGAVSPPRQQHGGWLAFVRRSVLSASFIVSGAMGG